MSNPTHSHPDSALPGPDDIVRREMSNGMVVMVRENPHVESVVITGSLHAGALYEPDELAGLAAFTASMLLRGTEQYDFGAIHELLEGNGASLSISSGIHTTGFSGKSLGVDLPLLFDLLTAALLHPTFPEEHVERLRGQIITAIKIREQDTRYMAGRTFRELAYPPEHPYHHSVMGQIDTIAAMSRDDMERFRQTAFGPRGMLIVVVGAVEAENVFALVERYFGGWANPTQPAAPDMRAIPALNAAVTQFVELDDKSQADLVLGVPGPSRFVEDWHAVSLANSILGVFGMYGRIGAEVREKNGMAYYSFSRLDGGLGPGAWRVMAGVNPVNVGPAVDAIRSELRRIVSEPVSQEELEDNKANYIGRLPLQLETNEGVAGTILTMERYGLGLDYLHHYADAVNAVSVDDVLAATQRYLDPETYALAVAGPAVNGHPSA